MTTQNTELKDLYTFQGHYTFDLHDLAAIVLRERQLSDKRFNRASLIEVCAGETAFERLPDVVRPTWNTIRTREKTAFSLGIEQALGSDAENRPLEIDEFFKSLWRMPPGRAPFSESEKEMAYWQIRHMDSANILCDTLQRVLLALPEDRTKLRIRTSQGHTIRDLSPAAFEIAEVMILPKRGALACTVQPLVDNISAKACIQQFRVGHSPMSLMLLLFGDSSVATTEVSNGSRVVLDLVSPLASMRGLGGELYAMERATDFFQRVLPTGSEEIIDINRIWGSQDLEVNAIVKELVERILRRLTLIASGEQTYCAYCGKQDSMVRCSTCKKAMYCGEGCQLKAWEYHKKWCNLDASVFNS